MIHQSFYWASLLLILAMSGCSSYRATALHPASSELLEAAEAAAASPSPVPRSEPEGELTLPHALALAFQKNPGLKAALLEIGAAEARALQAGLPPNPQIAIELENLAGSGALSGFDGTESTIVLTQALLLGGKLRKQRTQAALEGDLIAWDAAQKRLDLYSAVHNAFNRLLIAQEDIAQKHELLQLSDTLLATTTRRVQAGKVSPAETSRAQVMVAQNRIALERARRSLEAARRQLAATWGSREARFSRVNGQFGELFDLPPEDSLRMLLPANPDMARFDSAIQQCKAGIALEDARALPDLSLSAGLRHLNESGDLALVFGLSVPLPLADRNQGGRAEARQLLSKTEQEQEAVRIAMETSLAEAYGWYRAVKTEVQALQAQIIPQAEAAYRKINQGYLQGRFDFLDVLDAQRTLYEAKDRHLHALREFHETVVRIERLIARRIH